MSRNTPSCCLALALLFATLGTVVTAPAQCGGQGRLSLQIVSVQNAPIGPNSIVTIRLSGAPNEHVCLACDFGDGPTEIPDVGTVCLDLSPNLLELFFVMPPSGVIEFTVTIPDGTLGALLCCTAVGIDVTVASGVAISNSICFEIGDECDGGLSEVGHITRIPNVTSFPVDVTSSVNGRAGGSGDPSSTVSYDSSNPPSFPVSQTPSVFIESIVRDGDDLLVTTLVRASSDLRHTSHANRLPNECTFRVGVAGSGENTETVHTSCSQPIGVGMQFGAFTITNLTSRN